MKHLRFSIGALMGLVLLVAVGFAALRSTSSIWASSIFTATFLCLSVGLVGAFARRGAWLGFTALGWAYFLGAFWLWPTPNGVTAPPFVTKFLMDSLQPENVGQTVITDDTGPVGESSRDTLAMHVKTNASNVEFLAPFPGRVVYLLHYRRISHSLAALMFGIIGALVGRLLASRARVAEIPGPRA